MGHTIIDFCAYGLLLFACIYGILAVGEKIFTEIMRKTCLWKEFIQALIIVWKNKHD